MSDIFFASFNVNLAVFYRNNRVSKAVGVNIDDGLSGGSGQLGILIDVSHLSDPGFWDIMEYAPGPVIATHSNSRSVHYHTRNLTDEQITAIVKNRGVVGLNLFVNFMGVDPDIETVVAHLDHFWELGGEDVVALGGDWDGADPLVKGFSDVTGWKYLYEELLRRGYSETLVQKLFYSNMMRIVKEVCSISAPEM